MKLKILNTRKIKNIKKIMDDQWGCEIDEDYVFLENEKGKLFITNKDFSKINIDELKIQAVGIYFGELKNDELRLSIEGSQMVGNSASKNVIELDDEQTRQWASGNDIDIDLDNEGFLIIKNKSDFLGTGKYSIKNKRIYNFVPKERRVPII